MKATKDKQEMINGKFNYNVAFGSQLVKDEQENASANKAIKEKFLLNTFLTLGKGHCQYRFLLSTHYDKKTGCQHVWTHATLFPMRYL